MCQYFLGPLRIVWTMPEPWPETNKDTLAWQNQKEEEKEDQKNQWWIKGSPLSEGRRASRYVPRSTRVCLFFLLRVITTRWPRVAFLPVNVRSVYSHSSLLLESQHVSSPGSILSSFFSFRYLDTSSLHVLKRLPHCEIVITHCADRHHTPELRIFHSPPRYHSGGTSLLVSLIINS